MGTKLKTSTFHKNFGQSVQKKRKQKGLTQEKLAEEVGVDRSYMGFIERGEKNPTLDKVMKIADALDVEVSDLFYFQKKEEK